MADTPPNRGVHRRPWRVRSSQQYRAGRFSVTVDDIESPDGARQLTWTYIQARHAVVVLAVNERQEALLVREYRHPLGGDVLGLVAGAAHHCRSEDELLDQAARELAEEAGLQAALWRKIGDFCPLPSWSQASFHLFLATDLSPILERGDGPEWNEIEELVWVPLSDLHRQVVEGAYCDGPLVATVLWAMAKGLPEILASGSPL